MENILLTIAAICISILLIVIFYSKKGTNNNETKIYSIILKTNLLYCITDIVGFVIAIATGNTTLMTVLQKIQMIEEW